MFLERQTKDKLFCKNSWGEYNPIEIREVSKDSDAIGNYYTAYVKKLTFLGQKEEEGGIGNINILKYIEGFGYATIYKYKWDGYGRLLEFFDYYVDFNGKQTDEEHGYKPQVCCEIDEEEWTKTKEEEVKQGKYLQSNYT